MSTRLQRIAEKAQGKEYCFQTLAHLIDEELLRAAEGKLNEKASAGIDGVTAQGYRARLEANLKDLHERLRSGHYRATPVRRVHIPKEGRSKRPLGLPIYEDKVVERAVVMLLEPIYEHDFYGSSYGYRPEINAHSALSTIKEQFHSMGIRWVIDGDIKDYFGSINHKMLQEFIARRVNDGGIRRLIGKWLKAGVLEDGEFQRTESGTPQGGVISPLLANIYLHYVLDEWMEEVVKPRLRGKAKLIRYADDFVIGFQYEDDAKRVMKVLAKRLAKYDLTLHPEKTKLVKFGRPAKGQMKSDNGTFTFLGFLHVWTKSRRTGGWYVKQKIASKRFTRALKKLWERAKENRHEQLKDQRKSLSSLLQGLYGYYALPTNGELMSSLVRQTARFWHYWLNRRGADKYLEWTMMQRLLSIFPLPQPPRLAISLRRQQYALC